MGRIRTRWLCAALALGALFISGCATLATAPTKATATRTPAPALTWKAVTLPPNDSLQSIGWAVSPLDGHDAWVCMPGDAGAYTIWATKDAGVTWQHVGTFTAAIAGPARCMLVADQTSAQGLMADLSWGCGECGTLRDMTLYSADGGLQWRRLAGYYQPQEFTSFSGGIVAILNDTETTSSSDVINLVVSSDGFQTWRAIRPDALAANDSFFRFWLAPDGSSLIASSYNNTLWRTTDLGATWTQIPTPDEQTGLATWLSQRNTFHLCGWTSSDQMLIHCSDDLGAHWSEALAQTETIQCDAKCGNGVAAQTQPCPPSSMAPDGSLLASCTASTPTGPASAIYRLPLGGAVWQHVGTAPGNVTLVSATGPVWGVASDPNQIIGLYTAQLPF